MDRIGCMYLLSKNMDFLLKLLLLKISNLVSLQLDEGSDPPAPKPATLVVVSRI